MKKTILVLSVAISLFSCSKYSEQIEVSKNKLLELNATEKEVDKYEFKVIEAFDRDIYQIIISGYQKQVREFDGHYELQKFYLEKAAKYLEIETNLINKGELRGDKTYYIVHAYRIAGDTLNDKTFFIDDKNNIISFINKR